MTDLPKDNQLDSDSNPGKQVECAKCGAINNDKARRCTECHAHLFYHCASCHQRNPRSQKTCIYCGKNVGERSWWSMNRKYLRRFIKEKVPLKRPTFLVLIVFLGILVSWFVIRFLTSMDRDYLLQ